MDMADVSAGPSLDPLVSPTSVTNAIRRPKSPRRPHRKKGDSPTFNGFLAAETFQNVPSPKPPRQQSQQTQPQRARTTVDGGNDSSAFRRRSRNEMGVFSQFVSCQGPIKHGRPKSCTAENMNDVLRNARETAFSEPNRRKMAESSRQHMEGCVRTTRTYAPDEDQVRGCVRESAHQRRQFQSYAAQTYDLCKQECTPEVRSRGDDSAFFNSIVASQDQEETDKESISTGNSGEYDFRTARSMRYPEAAHIENRMDRRQRERHKGQDDDMRQEEAASEMNAVINNGENSTSMREFRLQLFKRDEERKTVSKSRLTRALGELALQDDTIETLQRSLEDTKEALTLTEEELLVMRAASDEQLESLVELRATAMRDKQFLEGRLEQETEESSKLRSMVSSLQVETSRLKSSLRSARAELRKQANQLYSVHKGDKSQPWSKEDDFSSAKGGDDAFPMDEGEEAALVTALRAEIVNLKAQLADVHAGQLQHGDDSSKESPRRIGERVEAIRLREKLDAYERELSTLRANQSKQNAAPRIIKSLEEKLRVKEEALKNVREELKDVVSKEQALRQELQEANEKILELEREREITHVRSLAEVESLKTRLSKVTDEAAEAKEKANHEFHQIQTEATELKTEVKCLMERLSLVTQESILKSAERMKERQKLERELEKSQVTEKFLQERIASLEKRLADATESASRQLLHSERSPSVESRSIKRKLGDSIEHDTGVVVNRETALADEKEFLREELTKSRAAENVLQAEISVMKDLLRIAEAAAAENKAEMDDELQERKETEATLMNEVKELKVKLEETEEKAIAFAESQVVDLDQREKTQKALQESQANEQTLLNEIKMLKLSLERAEMQCQDQQRRAHEERRVSRENESEKDTEIRRLKSQLLAKGLEEKEKDLLARVDALKQRLAVAESEVSKQQQLRKEAGDTSKFRDHTALKLRSELAMTKARLATARKAFLSPDGSTDLSSFETSSGDSASSMDMSMSPGRSVSSGQPGSPPFTPPRLGRRSSSLSMSPVSSRSVRWKGVRGGNTETLKEVNEDCPEDEIEKSPRKRVDLMTLQRRLLESNQRLLDANIRVKGMTKAGDDQGEGHFRVESNRVKLTAFANRHKRATSEPSRIAPTSFGQNVERFSPVEWGEENEI